MAVAEQPSSTIIDATTDELAAHAPFDRMERSLVASIAAKVRLAYYPKGASILTPDSGAVDRLFIVQRGRIDGLASVDSGSPIEALTLVEGEMFPVGALIARRASTLRFVASTDAFCYELPVADFEDAMDRSRELRHFATTRLAHLLQLSQRQTQKEFSERVSAAQTLTSPLSSLLRRAPVSVPPETSVRDVLLLMQRERIGSVVVVGVEELKPVGIFTERDVLGRVALPKIDQSAPISAVMTANPVMLASSATVFEAARIMAERRFRHIIVVEEGRLVGVVSERDLFALQRLSLGSVAKAIERAANVAELRQASEDVRRMALSLIGQGVAAEQLTQFVTTMNDSLVARALALAPSAAHVMDVDWCWIGLGSEGRHEQTLATDQDNALIFVPRSTSDLEATRQALLGFAREVNAILDQVGFPLCKGEIMAGNPKWCLTATEWRDVFTDWLRSAGPQALLNAAIFFDFRPLHGNVELANALRQWLAPAVAGHPLFLRHLAENALQVRPPLGVLRDFVEDDEYPGTLNLKKYAARPFIDAARVFALAQGSHKTNTAERLRAALSAMQVADDEINAYVDAFHFVQLLRLRTIHVGQSQDALEPAEQPIPANHLVLATLNDLDRRILKEALRQARKLQSRLEMDYRV